MYWTKELDDMIKIVMEEDLVMGIEVDGKRIFGVYEKSASTSADYLRWLESIGRRSRYREGELVGDWNAHHRIKEEGDRENGRGRTLQKWTTEEGYELVKLEGPTWERTGDGQQRASRIDLIFTKGTEIWEHPEKEKLTSDHWALFGWIEVRIEIGSQVWKVIDWEAVEATLQEEGVPEEEKGAWYRDLEGATAYEKLVQFKDNHLKDIRIGGRSKWWWDEELKAQLGEVRRVRRGGVRPGARGNEDNQTRLETWKRKSAQMKQMIKDKKEKCWRRFCEEHGERDP